MAARFPSGGGVFLVTAGKRGMHREKQGGLGSAFEARTRWGRGERRSRTRTSVVHPAQVPEVAAELVGGGAAHSGPLAGETEARS